MRVFHGFICLLCYAFTASASDMGNGPAAIDTWVIGGAIALVLALSRSTKEDHETQKHIFRWTIFMARLLTYSVIVFFAGIVAFVLW